MGLFLGESRIGKCAVTLEPSSESGGGSTSGIDTSDATLTSGDQMLDGVTSYSNGKKYVGTIPSRDESNVTISGNSITVTSGHYQNSVTKTLAVNTLSTPTIEVSSSGLITAKETQSAGYVEGSTKTATKQLTTKAAETFIPGTADKTIAANVYTTGVQTIKGDSSLISDNIISTASIFGVQGSVVIQNFYTGSDAPSNSLGSDGDLYFKK